MGIFDKRKSISRRELESAIKKDKGIIPGTGGKKYHERERQKMSKELFGSKYGSEIDKNDWRHRMRELDSEKRKAKTPGEKRSIDEKIRYYKEAGGKRV